MTHTHHPGIVAHWKLKINRKHYVEVFVWQDKESMYAANDYRCSFETNNNYYKEHDFTGYASSCIQAINTETGKYRVPRKFGEIYLVYEGYGGGVVAHEIAHIVNYWGGTFRWIRDGKHDEKSANLTGKLTNQFWVNHYRVFP